VRNYVDDLQRRAPDSLQRAASLATEQAWDKVELALARSPASGAAMALRGLARFAQSDFPGAANAWTATLEADPADAHAAFLLGWARAAAGDDRSAITAWRLASLRDPTLVPPYLALIDAYMRLGQPALALQVTRSGLAVLPDSPELRDRLHRLERH
jgi:lipopolysaccharide biosynthesis regulator YciM